MSSKRSTTTDESIDLFPFTEQEPFLGTDKRYYGYISGVGAGKTHAGIMRTVWNMESWNPGQMGAIVAPTTTMIKDVIVPLMRKLGLLQAYEYKSAHTEEPGIHAPNGSRALILSADNRRQIERLAGLNLSWWWLDEGCRTDARALEILEQRLRTGEYRNGYITTTPMGQDHIYEFFIGDHGHSGEWTEHGVADLFIADDRLAITRVPTWANPFTAEDYKQQMRDKEGQVYEREILGRFVDYEGLVYPWFDPEAHIRTADELEQNIYQMFYGVDWGYNNPAAIVAIAKTTGDELWVVDVFKAPEQDKNDMVDAANILQDEHSEGRFYCDPSEPAAIETFQRAGIDAIAAENDVLPGIQHVSAQRDRLRVLEHCQSLITEFSQYRFDPDSESEKPVKVNDHVLDALRYALFTNARHGGRQYGMEGLSLQGRSEPRYL